MDRVSPYSGRMVIYDSITGPRAWQRRPQIPEDLDIVGMTAAHSKFFEGRSDEFLQLLENLIHYQYI